MEENIRAFLTLCKVLNYRKTAEIMHLSQPAITKRIQNLEQKYQTRLFIYDGRTLHKTPKCELLENRAKSLQYNLSEIEKEMKSERTTEIAIGATKSIGENLLTQEILNITEKPGISLSFIVDNTRNLFRLLDDGVLDFLVVEGNFDKERYVHTPLKTEKFTGICAKNHRFENREITLAELFTEPFFVREPGSGTRDILTLEMGKRGYRASSFQRLHTISSFALIRMLVKHNRGVSFLYETVVENESGIGRFSIRDFQITHDFNIVYLKHTFAEKYVDLFFTQT